MITGIKLYGDDVFVTVSRWLPGVPSTMNRLIEKDGQTLLQPYPNWEWQNKGTFIYYMKHKLVIISELVCQEINL